MALNGNEDYPFTAAISFVVNCDTQEEVDRYWDKLVEGGEPVACGWLKDEFGLSWQVTPRILIELLQDPDPDKANRVMVAMMDMVKIDIAGLMRAYEGK
jgi:predicted 3-demethylubiquinone-9 3-methyltransferase (glyoxalase superfamily)